MKRFHGVFGVQILEIKATEERIPLAIVYFFKISLTLESSLFVSKTNSSISLSSSKTAALTLVFPTSTLKFTIAFLMNFKNTIDFFKFSLVDVKKHIIFATAKAMVP